jgi:alpha-L-arabinofuranosidase
MFKSRRLKGAFALVFLLIATTGRTQTVFKINPGKIKTHIEPTMWGVFFEDINMGADGGIYAELIKNRSFEFNDPLMGWKLEGKKEGEVLILNRRQNNAANPRYIQVTMNSGDANKTLTNEGFRGMGIKVGLGYDFSMMYKLLKPGIKLQLELLNENNEVIAKTDFAPGTTTDSWGKHSTSFNATATSKKAKFKITFSGEGTIEMDMISLFPSDTWMARKGGLRADMVHLLADMKPGFVRFPGGCIVEGYDLATRYQWKRTIGPVEERETMINRWNTAFAHRPAPDYYQTFGLGFFEYFQLAEDIGAEPLPILNCGMACQFNTAEIVPLDQLDPYVQDALDLIEFANGNEHSEWGKVRMKMGHPKPFNLKMIGVGNENWGPQYVERLKVFTKAIKAKYPEIKIISSAGPDPADSRFRYLDEELRKLPADFIDEHYYRKPDWFLSNVGRYDSYPRKGPKIFAGEYAAQSEKTVSPDNKNNLFTALAEAAFLTGLERNADIVTMASYAPLFAHVDGWQWTPDMIWVDNLKAYGTPNYFVQKMYATNRGTHVVDLTDKNLKLPLGKDGIYASAVIDKNTNELIIKAVNTINEVQTTVFEITGATRLKSKASLTVLTSGNVEDMNSIDAPTKIVPQKASIVVGAREAKIPLPANSFSVIRVKM